MRLLLDTHALIWWMEGSALLSALAKSSIEDEGNDVFLSAASAWEITTKHRLGKLPSAAVIAADVAACISAQGFHELPVSMRHAQEAGALPGPHRDPFDRILIVQSIREAMALVSNKHIFDKFGVNRLW